MKLFVEWISTSAHADFRDAHPRLQALFLFCAFDLRLQLPDVEVQITHVKSDDMSSTHAPNYAGACWSLDFDVKYDARWLPHSEVARAAVGRTKGLVERDYPYGIGTDGKWHHAFVWETTDGEHGGLVHLQVNRF